MLTTTVDETETFEEGDIRNSLRVGARMMRMDAYAPAAHEPEEEEIDWGADEDTLSVQLEPQFEIDEIEPGEFEGIKRVDLPVIYQVTELPDIEALRQFAASPEAERTVSFHKNKDAPDTEGDFCNMTLRAACHKYLKNIKYNPEVPIQFKRCLKGQMLVDKKVIKASRLYAYSDNLEYPYSITQLPKILKEIAFGKRFIQNDDAAAYHRIVMGLPEATNNLREMCQEIVENKNAVYQTIKDQIQNRRPHIGIAAIKEAIHAISNGQALTTTKKNLCQGDDGDIGEWLTRFERANRHTTRAICSNEKALFGIELIKAHYPKKHKKIYKDYDDNGVPRKLTKPKWVEIDVDLNKTMRSFFCQETEALGLEKKMDFFAKHGITSGPPIHDDLPCVFPENFSLDELSQALTDVVQTVPNYENALVKSEEYPTHKYSIGVKTDLEAAETVYNLYPHWVTCGGDLWVFDDEIGIWSHTQETHYKIIKRYDEHLYKYTEKQTKDGPTLVRSSTESWGSNVHMTDRCLKWLKARNVNERWLEEMEHTSRGKLLYKNGYYDMETGEFHDRFDPKIFFPYRIMDDYMEADDNEDRYAQSIKERIFVKPLGEAVAETLIYIISRAIAGDNVIMGQVPFCLGAGRAGKSATMQIISCSFQDYIGSFNGECLKYNNNSGGDEAQRLRWMKLHRWKRLVFSTEIAMKCDLDANVIKKMTGRGDKITARFHGKNEGSFCPQFMPFICANDLPKIYPFGKEMVDRTTYIFEYIKEFVDNPVTLLQLKRDPNLEKEMKTIDFQRAFRRLIFDSYQDYMKNGEPEIPTSIKENQENWMPTENEILTKFLLYYNITDNQDDWVANSDLNTWIKDKTDDSVTLKKLKAELKRHCVTNQIQVDTNFLKRSGGPPERGIRGISVIQISQPDDNGDIYFIS